MVYSDLYVFLGAEFPNVLIYKALQVDPVFPVGKGAGV